MSAEIEMNPRQADVSAIVARSISVAGSIAAVTVAWLISSMAIAGAIAAVVVIRMHRPVSVRRVLATVLIVA